MPYTSRVVRITTVGSAGAATGTGTVGLPPGKLVGIAVDYTDQPGTTDIVVTMHGTPDKTLLTLTSANTDIPMFVPYELTRDNVGATIAGQYKEPTVNGAVEVTVAQGDAATDGVVVTFIVQV